MVQLTYKNSATLIMHVIDSKLNMQIMPILIYRTIIIIRKIKILAEYKLEPKPLKTTLSNLIEF